MLQQEKFGGDFNQRMHGPKSILSFWTGPLQATLPLPGHDVAGGHNATYAVDGRLPQPQSCRSSYRDCIQAVLHENGASTFLDQDHIDAGDVLARSHR